MEAWRSATQKKTPRRIALLSRWPNHLSTRYRLLRRIQIQAHDIGHLFQKLRITRELKSLRAMRLEIVGAPDIVDGGLANTLALGHRPATPMRHPRGFGLQGRIHDIGNLVDIVNATLQTKPAG